MPNLSEVTSEIRESVEVKVPNSPTICAPDYLYNKADCLRGQGRFAESEAVYKRLVAIEFDIAGGCKGRVNGDLRQYLRLLTEAGKLKKASELQALIDVGEPSKADLKAFMIDPPNENDFVYHPILHSKAGHKLENNYVKNEDFKRLNNCVFYGLMRCTQHEYFEAAEEEAAKLFCARVRGWSKIEISNIAGQPEFSGGKVDCWPCSKDGEDIWIYRLGYVEIPLRLVFRGNRCIDSGLLSSGEDSEYSDWRANEIVKSAVGMSEKDIIEKFGAPYSPNVVTSEAVSKTAADGSFRFGYKMGTTDVELEMKNGVCTKASTGLIAY